MRGYIPPQNNEETIFCKKVISLFNKSSEFQAPMFSNFLNLRELELYKACFNRTNGLDVCFYSGYDGDTERCMAAVYPFRLSVEKTNFPLYVLVSPVVEGLTHRDYLGAIMNLKIKREFIGDIIISDMCYIVVHRNVANIIIDELIKVKNANVNFSYCYNDVVYMRNFENSKNVTVASMRADNIVSAVNNISRTEACSLIKQGAVAVNHLDIRQTDFEIFDKDIISIKQHGKFKICTDGNKSRKDRIFINYLKY